LLLLLHSVRQPVDIPIWVAQLLTNPDASRTERSRIERACREVLTARCLARTVRHGLFTMGQRVVKHLCSRAAERSDTTASASPPA
jgi:hypothetical protein